MDTFESGEGGAGHVYPEPTVRFHGDAPEGLRALAAAMTEGLPVAELRRMVLVFLSFLADNGVARQQSIVLFQTYSPVVSNHELVAGPD